MRKLWLMLLLAPLIAAPARADERSGDLQIDERRSRADARPRRARRLPEARLSSLGRGGRPFRRYAGAAARPLRRCAHRPTATGKAWTAVSFRTNTGELVAATTPGSPQAGVRALPNATIIAGGVMVEAAGTLVGAIGVSGAPGGDNDETCAKAGIAAIRDKLDF